MAADEIISAKDSFFVRFLHVLLVCLGPFYVHSCYTSTLFRLFESTIYFFTLWCRSLVPAVDFGHFNWTSPGSKLRWSNPLLTVCGIFLSLKSTRQREYTYVKSKIFFSLIEVSILPMRYIGIIILEVKAKKHIFGIGMQNNVLKIYSG